MDVGFGGTNVELICATYGVPLCLKKRASSKSGLLNVSLKADLAPPLLLLFASSDRFSILFELLEFYRTTSLIAAMSATSSCELRRRLVIGEFFSKSMLK